MRLPFCFSKNNTTANAGSSSSGACIEAAGNAPRGRSPSGIVSAITFVSLLAFGSSAWSEPAPGAGPGQALVLVARPAVSDALYGQSILVAREMPGGQHVGFIVNKPTVMKMTDAFPGIEPSKALTDPIYLGGSSNTEAVFALVQGRTASPDGTLQLTETLYVAISGVAVDKVLMTGAEARARFFVGAVVWQPGELADEIKQGAWYVLDATPEIVLPARTAGLWSELVRQAEISANAI